MFQPNEELKSFYQKELWNNKSFQNIKKKSKKKKENKSESEDDDFEK